jgi:hypothetical protein
MEVVRNSDDVVDCFCRIPPEFFEAYVGLMGQLRESGGQSLDFDRQET